MVDEEMRDFIQRGLGSAGFEVVGLQGKVEEVRQIKTAKEVDILRAVNTGTVEAVRQMRKCLYPGLTENEIASVLDNALRAAGMDPFFDIVLFDENGSNPHGGTNGSKVLEPETFVLIDVGFVSHALLWNLNLTPNLVHTSTGTHRIFVAPSSLHSCQNLPRMMCCPRA
jgi:Xaa-Pro aminopeptidase